MPIKRLTDETDGDLEFPVRAGPPVPNIPATVDMILAASEEFLAVWNQATAREKRRSRTRCRVPFVLSDS